MNYPDPPSDHGSDRYDYVEVSSESGRTPSGSWWEALLAEPCPDCRANIFAIELTDGPEDDRNSWLIQIAHDDTCPAYAHLRQGGTQ